METGARFIDSQAKSFAQELNIDNHTEQIAKTCFYYPKRPRQRHRDNRKWNSRNDLHWTYRRNRKKFSNSTELSKHIWTLKDNNTNFTINWSILATTPA